MPIPDYEAIMLPLLESLADGKEHQSSEVREKVARHFNLTDHELKALQPSGRMPLFSNRFHWARLYLDKAAVIETPRRGWYRLTSRGKALLEDRPLKVNTAELMRFPELREFLGRAGSSAAVSTHSKSSGSPPASESRARNTPDEALESAYHSLRSAVEGDLLDAILAASPSFFEQLVIKLLVAMGYGGSIQDAGQAIGRTGDGGIDGRIKEDKLGLDVIYVQAKRWQGTVGAKEVRDFAGSIDAEQARKGIFITTSTYSRDAQEYVRKSPKRIVLIEGAMLASLMFDYGIGVTTAAAYEVKRVDADFFVED